jgi:ribosomal protein S18 acetylase RimI-like enzyme
MDVTLRVCRAADLRKLEWFGWFTRHRSFIEEAFRRQQLGEVIMVVAEANGFPVGQVWIDLVRNAERGAGLLWALRVLPGLQGGGVGTRMIAYAEALLRARGLAFSEIGVERHNRQARRLYERLGYQVSHAERHTIEYETPGGKRDRMRVDEWILRKPLRARRQRAPTSPHELTTARARRERARLVVRWTIGDVSSAGFEALRLSVWSATKLFGRRARYVVCVNSVPLDVARARAGELPEHVEWRDVSDALWPEIRPYLADNYAEGVAWKFAPLRLDVNAHELALDNDCILWAVPRAVEHWLAGRSAAGCVIAEDVRPCFGQFAARCGPEPRNSGIRGIPAGFDFGGALLETLREYPVKLSSELDEQGLQVAALQRRASPAVVSTREVSICSPFPPHLPHLGECGAHFVGLNAKSMPWSLDGTPAVDLIQAHWRRHRRELYDRVGISPARDDGIIAADWRA